MLNTNPFMGLMRTLALMAARRIRYYPEDRGRLFVMDDGRRFTVFRRVVIKTPAGAPGPGAVFIVRFTPASMSVKQNISFSRIPMLKFMGFTGFRSKYWCVDTATGMCQGIYEWQTRGDAERYAKSIAMRFMTRRSIPGSVTAVIMDQVDGDVSAKLLSASTQR